MNPVNIFAAILLAWFLLALVGIALSDLGPLPGEDVPPAPEAPAVPKDFRPRKHKAVKDRLAWRKVHPREAEAIARHARQLHFHEQEEAELREATR